MKMDKGGWALLPCKSFIRRSSVLKSCSITKLGVFHSVVACQSRDARQTGFMTCTIPTGKSQTNLATKGAYTRPSRNCSQQQGLFLGISYGMRSCLCDSGTLLDAQMTIHVNQPRHQGVATVYRLSIPIFWTCALTNILDQVAHHQHIFWAAQHV